MKEKDYNIELIRTVSFILVIVIHVTNYFCRAYGRIGAGEYLFSLALDVFARVSVPCFFMISGALLLGREEPLARSFGRLGRFLLVLAFWSAVYYVHNVYYMGTPVSIWKLLYEPAEQHLWYLYAMIPIYLVLPFFQIMCRGMDETLAKVFLAIGAATVVFLYVTESLNGEPYYDTPIFGDRVYDFYFFLGYFIYRYRDRIRLGVRALAAVFVGSGLGSVALTWFYSQRAGDHVERFLEYRCPLVISCGCSFFLLLLRAAGGRYKPGPAARRLIDAWSACSFGIYLIHILFLDIFKKYVEAYEVSVWAAVPLLTAALLLVSFASVYLIRKLPGGKKIT